MQIKYAKVFMLIDIKPVLEPTQGSGIETDIDGKKLLAQFNMLKLLPKANMLKLIALFKMLKLLAISYMQKLLSIAIRYSK
ncbi:hypothetical protein M0802_011327 [Mischocyttarus mexicanus]|nr:hypothetical protein M0802_011327 [Mischocyttarus mexicanus]